MQLSFGILRGSRSVVATCSSRRLTRSRLVTVTFQLLWKYTQSKVLNKCTHNKTLSTHLGISAGLTAVALMERCGWIIKKSSRKHSWYQDYLVLLMSPFPLVIKCRRHLLPKMPETFWTQAESILVQRTIDQNTEVFLFFNFHWTWISFGSFESVCSYNTDLSR